MFLFNTITHFPLGTFYELLVKGYQNFFQDKSIDQLKYQADWWKFDQEVFANPDTIGKCVFVTTLNDQVIGFASFDPPE